MAGLWLTQVLVPGIRVQGAWTFALAAVLTGLVNGIGRPLAIRFTLPVTILSLGLFLLVINAAMYGLVAALLEGFSVAGSWSAMFGWLILSLTDTLASWHIGPDGRYQVLVIRRRQSANLAALQPAVRLPAQVGKATRTPQRHQPQVLRQLPELLRLP